MRIKLPKELGGTQFSRVTMIDLNQFDVDLALPALFFRILSEGTGRGRLANDPTAINDYVRALRTHVDLEGFNDADGERVLHRLARTSLVITARITSRKGRGEHILAAVPHRVLSHKTEFPAQSSRPRNVDAFLYESLRERSGSEFELKRFTQQVFGRGVKVNPVPYLGGEYDGVTDLDTLTRLSLAFLDGFKSTSVGRKLKRTWTESCPGLSRNIGWDTQHYLYSYHDKMAPEAMSYHLMGLINMELFVYTLKLVHAVNNLVNNPSELPAAMESTPVPSSPDIYIDFTGEPGGRSQQMAMDCVRRDLDAYGQFLRSVLTLRLLDRYANLLSINPQTRREMDTIVEARNGSSPLYLRALLQMKDHPLLGLAISLQAGNDEMVIRRANQQLSVDEEAEDDLRWLDSLLPDHLTPFERVLTLVAESQKKTLQRFGPWFWGSGGLLKPHGILAGTPKGRRAWRYQPRNDLLTVFVQMAAIQPHAGFENGRPHAVRLRAFLDYLHQRFGILIDRPPASFSGAEPTAAARDNLRAMLRRLRQMGIFRDLSDDFTVQALQPPYAVSEMPV